MIKDHLGYPGGDMQRVINQPQARSRSGASTLSLRPPRRASARAPTSLLQGCWYWFGTPLTRSHHLHPQSLILDPWKLHAMRVVELADGRVNIQPSPWVQSELAGHRRSIAGAESGSEGRSACSEWGVGDNRKANVSPLERLRPRTGAEAE